VGLQDAKRDGVVEEFCEKAINIVCSRLPRDQCVGHDPARALEARDVSWGEILEQDIEDRGAGEDGGRWRLQQQRLAR
jgi:hypothetical protein